MQSMHLCNSPHSHSPIPSQVSSVFVRGYDWRGYVAQKSRHLGIARLGDNPVGCYITRSIVIGMRLITAGLALESRLRLPILALGMPTLGALLRSVARINVLNSYAVLRSLSLQQGLLSSEAPPMQAPLLSSSSALSCLANLGKVFENQDRTGFQSRQNLLDDVLVAPSAKPRALPANSFQATFSRFAAFTLERTFSIEIGLIHFMPIGIAKQFPSGQGCWGHDASVAANQSGILIQGLFLGIDNLLGQGQSQPPLAFGILIDLATIGLPIHITQQVLVTLDGNSKTFPFAKGSQRDLLAVCFQAHRSDVVRDGQAIGMWARGFFAFFQTIAGRLNRTPGQALD